jgi:hypothetical protein
MIVIARNIENKGATVTWTSRNKPVRSSPINITFRNAESTIKLKKIIVVR